MRPPPWLVEFEQKRALCRAWFNPDLTEPDREWLREHVELAGQRVPEVDVSWIYFEGERR